MKKITKTLGLLILLVLASCSPNDDSKDTLRVGTEGVYPPFSYFDSKGKITGYDVELAKEVAKKLGVEVKFVPTAWEGMFMGLQSNKFDLVANQVSQNDKRDKLFYFSSPYLYSGSQIIVRKGEKNIESLRDLKGMKVALGVGSNHSKMVEDFNKNKIFDLKYYDGNILAILQDLSNGRVDATVNDRLTVGQAIKEKNINVEIVGKPLSTASAHFVFRKDSKGQRLQEKFNHALKELEAEGKLKELSKKYFGSDFSKN